MKIELRNFRPAHSQSQETLAFTAAIHADGVRVGHVSNAGRGGANDFRYVDRETMMRVRAAIEAMPPDSRFPLVGMTEDMFYTLLADSMVAADDAKRVARKEREFAIMAKSRNLRAWRVTLARDGDELRLLAQWNVELTTESTYAKDIAKTHRATLVKIDEITGLAPSKELTIDEAHGVMKMAQVLRARSTLSRADIPRDAALDWLLERGFIKVVNTKRAQPIPVPYATKAGREWFHSTPGAGVAMLVISMATRKAS